MKQSKTTLITVTSCLLAWAGCKARSPESQTKTMFSEGSDYLWDDPSHIPVCWEDFGDKYLERRKLVQDTVTREYARAGLHLTGWKACKPGDKGIWVAENPRSDTLDTGNDGRTVDMGKKLDGVSKGMQLLFDDVITNNVPQNERGYSELAYCAGDFCLLNMALHEFGHAMGLQHEMDRRDSTCTRTEYSGLGTEASGSITVGPYDKDSIMNYCNYSIAADTGREPKLSDLDVLTLKYAYSKKTVFPRETACREDGHSWKTLNMAPCCEKQATGKIAAKEARNYLFCEELKEFTSNAVVIEKWVTALTGPLAFEKPGIGILECDKNDFVVNLVARKDPVPAGYKHAMLIRMENMARNNPGSQQCHTLTIYDQVAVTLAKQAVRYKFSPAVPFAMDRVAQDWDLSKTPFQTLTVKEGRIEGDKPPQPALFEAKYSFPPHQGNLIAVIPKIMPDARVYEGTLQCGEHKLAVVGQSIDNEEHIFKAIVTFDHDVLGNAPSITCTELKLKLSTASKLPLGAKPTESEASYAFSKPVTMKTDGTNYTMDLPETCFKNLQPTL